MKRINEKRIIDCTGDFSVNATAQSFGIQAGYINSKESGSNEISGFQVGPAAELSLSNNLLVLQYGVLYNYLTKTESGVVGTNTYTGHFVDVPLRLKLGFPIDENIQLFAFGGPNFNIGLAQQVKNVSNILGSEVITTIDRYAIDADDDAVNDISRFDLQLGIGGGVQYQNIQLKVGYDWGLLDLDHRTDYLLKRNQLTASVLFRF